MNSFILPLSEQALYSAHNLITFILFIVWIMICILGYKLNNSTMNLGEGTPRQFQKGLLQRVSNLLFRIVILFLFLFIKQGIHSIIYYDKFLVMEIL